jgi:hypothetical protein
MESQSIFLQARLRINLDYDIFGAIFFSPDAYTSKFNEAIYPLSVKVDKVLEVSSLKLPKPHIIEAPLTNRVRRPSNVHGGWWRRATDYRTTPRFGSPFGRSEACRQPGKLYHLHSLCENLNSALLICSYTLQFVAIRLGPILKRVVEISSKDKRAPFNHLTFLAIQSQEHEGRGRGRDSKYWGRYREIPNCEKFSNIMSGVLQWSWESVSSIPLFSHLVPEIILSTLQDTWKSLGGDAEH